MKGLFCLLIVVLAHVSATAQNVGIGTAAPLMKFHVSNFDSAVLLLENTQSLNTNISTSLYFKTGNGSFPYTGALKTTGTGDDGSDSGARIGLFSGISATPTGLLERLSITDDGSVGIGTTTPIAKLDVAGDVRVNGKIGNVTDPIAAQDAATKHYVDQMANQVSEVLLDAGLNGVVIDIDGNVYKTIKIGTQVWMAQNLKSTRYNNGTMIPKVTDNAEWGGLSTPGYCWYENDSTLHAKKYGALYNYYTVADTNSLNVCPTGWHVPSDAEWTILSDFLTANGYGFEGSGTDIGKSLALTFGWTSNGTEGTVGNDQGTNNSCGFAGLPGGDRSVYGMFINIGFSGYWWSSTKTNSNFGWNRYLYSNDVDLKRITNSRLFGYSVRCLRD